MPIGENPETRFGPPNDFKSEYTVIETEEYQPEGDMGQQALRRFNVDSKRSYRLLRPLLRILYRFYTEVFHYPDKEKGWRSPAVETAERFLERERVDALMSSSSPVTCHIVARALKKEHGVPWVADLRDLWTQNHAYPHSALRRMAERRLELATLGDADALVVVSWPAAEQLSKLHRREDVSVITNGFDPERLNQKDTALTSRFTITYSGQIYAGRQDPSKLLVALKELVDGGTVEPVDVEVRFYGPENTKLADTIEECGLSSIAKQHGVVPRQVAHEKQRESHLLLLLNWDDRGDRGVYTLKVFEYLASRRPILATGGFGNDVVEALLQETGAGVYCRTVQDIKAALEALYLEYKLHGKVNYAGDSEKINKYSYREMAGQFAAVLEGAAGAARG